MIKNQYYAHLFALVVFYCLQNPSFSMNYDNLCTSDYYPSFAMNDDGHGYGGNPIPASAEPSQTARQKKLAFHVVTEDEIRQKSTLGKRKWHHVVVPPNIHPNNDISPQTQQGVLAFQDQRLQNTDPSPAQGNRLRKKAKNTSNKQYYWSIEEHPDFRLLAPQGVAQGTANVASVSGPSNISHIPQFQAFRPAADQTPARESNERTSAESYNAQSFSRPLVRTFTYPNTEPATSYRQIPPTFICCWQENNVVCNRTFMHQEELRQHLQQAHLRTCQLMVYRGNQWQLCQEGPFTSQQDLLHHIAHAHCGTH